MDTSDISLLFPYFRINEYSTIYCICDDIAQIIQNEAKAKQIHINFRFSQQKGNYSTFVTSFLNHFQQNESCPLIIGRCLSELLIRIGFHNAKYDRITNFQKIFSNKFQDININKDEFIELKFLAYGSSSSIFVVYHIEWERICILKMFQKPQDDEGTKLFNREYEAYKRVHHPLIPRYYGSVECDDYIGILIEYIQGESLYNVNKAKLSKEEIYKIILEMILIIQYIHYKGYIYRDLKPDNVIIDENKRAYLIDFDRAVNKQSFTKNFSHSFYAPEIEEGGPITNKADIYSLGKVLS